MKTNNTVLKTITIIIVTLSTLWYQHLCTHHEVIQGHQRYSSTSS